MKYHILIGSVYDGGTWRTRYKVDLKDLTVGRHDLLRSGIGEDDTFAHANLTVISAGGDSPRGFMELIDSTEIENYLEITSISADSTIIEGTFQFHLSKKRKEANYLSEYPDTMILTEGFFRANRYYIDE